MSAANGPCADFSLRTQSVTETTGLLWNRRCSRLDAIGAISLFLESEPLQNHSSRPPAAIPDVAAIVPAEFGEQPLTTAPDTKVAFQARNRRIM